MGEGAGGVCCIWDDGDCQGAVIADSSCRAVPGRWTLEPGAPLGWTPTRGVGGVSPQRPLLLGSQHPWNLALEDSRVNKVFNLSLPPLAAAA